MNKFEQTVPNRKAEQDNLQDKISLIEKVLNIDYTQENKNSFDEWLQKVPHNSFESPMQIKTVEQILDLLPPYANYDSGQKINLFFSQEENFNNQELKGILEKFSIHNPDFEISVVKHEDKLISIGIGDKVRNKSTILEGEYIGHYHPTQFKFENQEKLPRCFVSGLMPSYGDIKEYFKNFKCVENGTTIFSSNGLVKIRFSDNKADVALVLEGFEQIYFDLFLGKCSPEINSDQKVLDYFDKKFGMHLQFEYNSDYL